MSLSAVAMVQSTCFKSADYHQGAKLSDGLAIDSMRVWCYLLVVTLT